MNFFEKRRKVKQLKKDILDEFESYFHTQTKTNDILYSLANVVYDREKSVQYEEEALNDFLNSLNELNKTKQHLKECENLYALYKDNSNYNEYWKLKNKLTELKNEYESATKTVTETEHYTDYKTVYQRMSVGSRLMTVPKRKAVERNRTVTNTVPDEEKRQEIEKEIKKVEEQLLKNPEFQTLETVGNVAVKLNDAQNAYNNLLSITNNKSEVERLIMFCKKSQTYYFHYDKEISKLTKEYNSAKQTSDRWKNSFNEVKQELIDLKQQKFYNLFNEEHKEELDKIENINVRSNIYKKMGYQEITARNSYLHKIENNEYTPTVVNYDERKEQLSKVEAHLETLNNIEQTETMEM